MAIKLPKIKIPKLGTGVKTGIAKYLNFTNKLNPVGWTMPKMNVDKETGKVTTGNSLIGGAVSKIVLRKDGTVRNPIADVGNWFTKGFAKIGLYAVGFVILIMIIIVAMVYFRIPFPNISTG